MKSGKESKNFMAARKFMEELFKNVTDFTLASLKKFFEQLSAQIQRREDAVKGYTDVKTLLNECREAKGKTVLHFAAARGDIDVFDYLLSLGASLDSLDDEKNNAFFIAVQHQKLKLVKHLIEKLNVDPAQKR